MNTLPLLAQGITWSPTALIIAAVILLVGILVLRFLVKTALTIAKIAIVALIAAGAYLGFQSFL